MFDLEQANVRNAGWISGKIGVKFTHLANGEVDAELPVAADLISPSGTVNGGIFVLLADICCGLGQNTSRPPESKGFATIESKTNYLKPAKAGTIVCRARQITAGKSTRIWDAEILDKDTEAKLALFRCTQLIIY